MLKRIKKFIGVATSAFVLGQVAFTDNTTRGQSGSGGDANAASADVVTETPTYRLENPLKSDKIEDLLTNVYSFMFTISAALVAIFILLGAYQIMTSGGNPERVTQGRKTILWAIVGFALVIVAGGAASIIGNILGTDTPIEATGDSTPIQNAGDIADVLMTITQWMFGILMALGVVFVLYSAFLYLTSGGDQERVSTARQALTYAIIAMIIGVLAGGASSLVRNIFDSSPSSNTPIDYFEDTCTWGSYSECVDSGVSLGICGAECP